MTGMILIHEIEKDTVNEKTLFENCKDKQDIIVYLVEIVPPVFHRAVIQQKKQRQTGSTTINKLR